MDFRDLPEQVYIIGNLIDSVDMESEKDDEGNDWICIWTNKNECQIFKKANNYPLQVSKIKTSQLAEMLFRINSDENIPATISYVYLNPNSSNITKEKTIKNKSASGIINILNDPSYLYYLVSICLKNTSSIEKSKKEIENSLKRNEDSLKEREAYLSEMEKYKKQVEKTMYSMRELIEKTKNDFSRFTKRSEFTQSIDEIRTVLIEFSGAQRARYIPNEVRKEVWIRDLGRCTLCGSYDNIEFDHMVPVSKGGSNSVNNIELLCRKCNRSKSDKNPGDN